MAAPPAGLKAGLEVHQQLDTREKLFCRCPTRPGEASEKTVEFLRLLRPTAGEAGKVDVAALEESRRARRFRYLGYDTTCLVENDEEPPRELNPEALEVALQAALLLGMEPVGEVHVMRKAVLDGSNTTGFQRTALIATGGAVETPSGRVDLSTLCLEEDAAAIVGQEGNVVTYSLDRLGIPLVEIATEAQIHSPAQAREVARHIGMMLRSTDRAKRGLGSVRQDVNVSVAGGARVEIKGVQDLSLVERVAAFEAERQRSIIELYPILRERKTYIGSITDVTFTEPKKAICLRGFGDLRDSLAKGFSAIAHANGLSPISFSPPEDVYERLSANPEEDMVIVVQGPWAELILQRIAERAKDIIIGKVKEETRRAREDGTSEYLRPLPGAARMYPETDVHPVLLTSALLDRIRRNLPELLAAKQRRFMERYGLNEELAAVALERAALFEAWAASAPAVPASGVVRALGALERLEPLPVALARDLKRDLSALLGALDSLRASLPPAEWGRKYQPAQAELERLLPLLQGASDAEARAVVERLVREKAGLVRERGEGAHGPLMGLAMKELHGKADGALVARLLKEQIEALLKTG